MLMHNTQQMVNGHRKQSDPSQVATPHGLPLLRVSNDTINLRKATRDALT